QGGGWAWVRLRDRPRVSARPVPTDTADRQPGASLMAQSTALLISADLTLITTVEKVVASTAELRLEVFPGVDEVRPRLTAADVVLVLAHLDHKAELEDVACLLHMIAEARRSTAILVLAEEHRPEQALALLRQGAADYLSRPLDLSRLAYLLDVL